MGTSNSPESGCPAALGRRGLLRGGLLAGGGAIAGGLIAGTATHEIDGADTTDAKDATVPFWGAHQAGIVTDTQLHSVLASFDLNTTSKDDVIAVLQRWTTLAAALTAGESTTIPIYYSPHVVGAYANTTRKSTTSDSLEAWQLGPQRLTLTIGFGPGLFVGNGEDRFGVADKRPPQLVDLPRFPGDQLDDSQSHGDLFIQACGDDPQVVFHAVRSMARIAPDIATLRWTQIGFSPSNDGGTPRNLMGFKDGTINSNAHPPADLDSSVWAGKDSPGWMHGGSYLVYRRIRITLENWDRLPVDLQEQVIGRSKVSGAPLGAKTEFDALDLTTRSGGQPVIPATAHARLAAPESNGGAIILRRAFSYNNGTTPFVERWPPWRQALEYDAGLLFLAYQTDPRTAFIRINNRLAIDDALNQFTTHTASGIFAIPPGAARPGNWIGEELFS